MSNYITASQLLSNNKLNQKYFLDKLPKDQNGYGEVDNITSDIIEAIPGMKTIGTMAKQKIQNPNFAPPQNLSESVDYLLKNIG